MLKLFSTQYLQGFKAGKEKGSVQKMYGGVNEVERGIIQVLPPSGEYVQGFKEGYREGYAHTLLRFTK
jgi:hypothetical protein